MSVPAPPEPSPRADVAREPGPVAADLALAGLLVGENRDLPVAVACLERVLGADRDHQEAHRLLGIAHALRADYRQAVRHLASAFLLSGKTDRVAAINLAIYLDMLAVTPGTLAVLEDVADTFPDDIHALLRVIRAKLRVCRWDGLERYIGLLLPRLDHEPEAHMNPHALFSIPGCDAVRQRHYAASYSRYRLGSVPSDPRAAADRAPARAGEKEMLDIGYFSSDFREHAVSFLTAGIFARHDRRRVRVHAFSFKREAGSAMQARVMAAVDHWHDLQDGDPATRLAAIRAAGLDIAIDLSGWTKHTWRSLVADQRVAPVVVNWLGYAGTLGLPELADYIIGDPWLTPLEHAGHYSETIAMLPHCYMPNDREREIGARTARADAGLPREGFVFCSFNQTYKIAPAVFDVWCGLLRDVPGSVLWMRDPDDPFARANLIAAAGAHGLGAERLVFAPRVERMEAHLGRLQCADLALDTLPYNSHTTGSDALWAGVPMVTCPGDTFAGRVGASLVAAAGLPELIARDLEEYRRLALDLARDRPRLESLRARLRDGRRTVPLFDTARFTRDLERLYRRMRDDRRAGRKEAIVLAP